MPFGITIGVTGAQLDGLVAVGQFEPDADGAGDHVQQLVAIGMDLTVVGRVAGEIGRPDGQPVDALRAPARLFDDAGLAVGAVQSDHLAGQIDASPGSDLVRLCHTSPFPFDTLRFAIRRENAWAIRHREADKSPEALRSRGRMAYERPGFWGCGPGVGQRRGTLCARPR